MKRIIAALVAVLAVGCTQVDTGNVGIESVMGQVKEQTLTPGVYFTLFKNVHEVSAKEVPVALENLSPKTSDNVTLADMDVSIYFRLAPEQAAKVFVRYSGDAEYSKEAGAYLIGAGVVTRLARESAYRSAAKYHSSNAHTKRIEIAADIRESLQAELDGDVGKGTFLVTNVIVRNLVTDPKLEQSIKEAAEVEFQIRRKKQEIELAKAEADRKRIEAEGEARANRIIDESLSNRLIELRRVEMTGQFAKQGTHTIVLPGNATPLVQVK